MKRRQGHTRVWRVRGYDAAGAVRHTRVYQRRHDAIRNYMACWTYYAAVTIEHADIGEWQPMNAAERDNLVRWSR